MSALTPGLYRATVRGVTDQIVMLGDRTGSGHPMHGDHVAMLPDGLCVVASDRITDARPLIVLDINHVAAEYVIDVLRSKCHLWANKVADQLEAQTKPARIPEPQHVGAKVAAADGGVAHTPSTGPWMRFSTILISNWIDAGGRKRKWDDLIDPILIREGGNL